MLLPRQSLFNFLPIQCLKRHYQSKWFKGTLVAKHSHQQKSIFHLGLPVDLTWILIGCCNKRASIITSTSFFKFCLNGEHYALTPIGLNNWTRNHSISPMASLLFLQISVAFEAKRPMPSYSFISFGDMTSCATIRTHSIEFYKRGGSPVYTDFNWGRKMDVSQFNKILSLAWAFGPFWPTLYRCKSW